MDKSGYLDVLYRRMGYFAFTLCVIYITIGFYTPRDAVLYMYKTPGSDATTGGGRYILEVPVTSTNPISPSAALNDAIPRILRLHSTVLGKPQSKMLLAPFNRLQDPLDTQQTGTERRLPGIPECRWSPILLHAVSK